MKTKRSASRRSFLRAVGVGATALPFYRLLEDSFAVAAGEALPLKLIAMSHPHGLANEYWNMRTPTSPDIKVESASMVGTDTETSFDIKYPNCSLQPFDDAATYGKSYKDRILTIEGLDLASDGHDATASILTGSTLNGGKPANSSLDQYLAVEKGLGSRPRRATSCWRSATPIWSPGRRCRTAPAAWVSARSSRPSRPSITCSAPSCRRVTARGRPRPCGGTRWARA